MGAVDEESDEFHPETRLEGWSTRLISAGIVTIPDMETQRECGTYENAHQNRTQILRRIGWENERITRKSGKKI